MIRRGWFHLASGAGIGRVLSFASNLLLSRWLGPTDLGVFNLVTTTVQTSDTLVRCGGDYALNYELGANPQSTQTEDGVQLVHAFSQICSLMMLIVCSGVALWSWLSQDIFGSSLVGSQRWILSAILLVMIALEAATAPAWEVLLVTQRTASFALKQGLFLPIRLLLAASGALFGGILGAMLGWCFATFVQCLWLWRLLGPLCTPLRIWPLYTVSIFQLLKRGLPFYGANLLSSLIFYPLLLKVALESGFAEVGYLRAGQILQQMFAFLPSTLAPVLFLRLRAESSLSDQAVLIERPLRLIWFVLLEIMLLYCIFDRVLIEKLFGSGFELALLPTRLLLITALFESLSQIVLQPLLASGQTRIYAFSQNVAAVFAAALGWLWIPEVGLAAYLIVRLIYVIIPFAFFSMSIFKRFQESSKLYLLALVTTSLLVLLLLQVLNHSFLASYSPFLLMASAILLFFQRDDVDYLKQVLIRRS